MQWWKRIIRIGRMGLLGVAGVCLLLYAASFAGVWWYTPWRVMFWAKDGGLSVDRYGPGATVTRPGASTGTGGPKGLSVTFRTAGMSEQTRQHWLWSTTMLRGSPMGGPAPKPGSYSVNVGIRLGRLALVSGTLGGLLLLVPARRTRPGTCQSCGYDRSGLVSGSACPECGAPSAEAKR